MSSIKDVAKLAGVSVATVSRVINDKGKVKEKTRDAIEQAMIQLSYHPNAMAQSLVKSNRSKIIAVFFMSPYLPFFSELIFYIEEALSEKGYKLLLLTSYMDEVKERKCVELVNSHLVDGLIIGSYPLIEDMLLKLPLPCVTVETALSDKIPCVMSDDYQGGILGTRHLIAKGCRHLALITGCYDELMEKRKMHGREQGFAEVCQQAGVEHRMFYSEPEMIRDLDFSVLINRVFYEYPEVDGILANSDLVAAEVVRIGVSQGYKVPERLKVVGFDGTKISRLFNPPLTAVAQNIKELAVQTVDTLIAVIEGHPYQWEKVIPVNLVERQST